MEFGVQTDNDFLSDYVIQKGLGTSKIERAKLNSREKTDRSDKISKNKILRASETSSIFKEPK
jgi:hypothetical protein